MSKVCGLGPAGFPAFSAKMSPFQRFPFKHMPDVSPLSALNHHSVHTAIPNMFSMNSLGDFLNNFIHP
ncbi:MAG TPA: hypothetical protein DD426_03300 [Clostridiaceae bacterium]|nr:hypothetical protein [Clostridiaceae bacterium]